MRKNQKIMVWVNGLPQHDGKLREFLNVLVGRDLLVSLVDQADQLTAQAVELRAEAFRQSLSLESKVRLTWREDEIELAKRKYQ